MNDLFPETDHNLEYRPAREPDLIVGDWWFYWEEMVQLNPGLKHLYKVALIDDELYYFDDNVNSIAKRYTWQCYKQGSPGYHNRALASLQKFYNKKLEESLLDTDA